MAEEQQHQKEILQAGEKVVGAIQHAVISSAILRRPRVKIEIKTAKQALAYAKEGIRKKIPADVVKHQIRTSKFAKLVTDPKRMAEKLFKGAKRKVALEKHGPAIQQAQQRNQRRDQGRGHGPGLSR
ncbi:hypothetical protein HRE53_29680 (plasmid) [Acaryochloris sp. 'Moss Beach']|uniref:hypothetical protein n=1 Tax=Acaryochloris sp. 'Moss Beach' TaxID=2740837 RepID=UPI001F457112|nr:hypothetical protein [Acaryochloris sp. 'Moss Beach']UJB72784.1 hypothetical protein HRE53_29680 [Acaryochloris sp. 'Moss Beach']